MDTLFETEDNQRKMMSRYLSRSSFRINFSVNKLILSSLFVYLLCGVWVDANNPQMNIGDVQNVKECMLDGRDRITAEVTVNFQGAVKSNWSDSIRIVQEPTQDTICATNLIECSWKYKYGCYCKEKGDLLYKVVVNTAVWHQYNNGYLKVLMVRRNSSISIESLNKVKYPVVAGPTNESLLIGKVLHNTRSLKRLNYSKLLIPKDDVTVLFSVPGLTPPSTLKMVSLHKSETATNQTSVSLILNLYSRFIELHYTEYAQCHRQAKYSFAFLGKKEYKKEKTQKTAGDAAKSILTKDGYGFFFCCVLGKMLALGLNH